MREQAWGSLVVNRIRNNICFCDVAGDEITLRPVAKLFSGGPPNLKPLLTLQSTGKPRLGDTVYSDIHQYSDILHLATLHPHNNYPCTPIFKIFGVEVLDIVIANLHTMVRKAVN
jgi:hypothetical protein